MVWASNYRSNHGSCCCDWLFYPDYISRNLCIYRFYQIDVTDWSNSGNFGNLIALLFYQHVGYL